MGTQRIDLVLGAGGAFGWVFHTGVVRALTEELGIATDDVDLIIGTSAGAAIGAALRAGVAPSTIASSVVRPPTDDDRRAMLAEIRAARKTLVPFAPKLLHHAIVPSGHTFLGLAGLLPPGVFPTSWMATFPGMEGLDEWPKGLWIPAVDAANGEVVVFGRDRLDVDVHRAAEASSAIPGMFQPHEIDGIPYFDGGVVSPTHADLAVDNHPDLVVVSSPMTRPGRRFTSRHARVTLEAEVDRLRAAGIRVVVVEPDDRVGGLANGFPRRTGWRAGDIADGAGHLTRAALAGVASH